MALYITDRTGAVIIAVPDAAAGQEKIEEYESEDRLCGVYVPNYYNLVSDKEALSPADDYF